MLSKEETTLLIRRAKDGDNQAKEELVKANSPLIKSLIKRIGIIYFKSMAMYYTSNPKINPIC